MTGPNPGRALEIGAKLGNRYTLSRRLGAGRATETWLAGDGVTGTPVALKILSGDTLGADSLRREWQIGLRLMHAHIVRVFEFHDETPAYYSLQFIDGPDLSVLAGAPLEDSLPCITLIADALRYAHAKDVVHRDVKASNVLLDPNGAPYLIDFGIAASRGDDPGGGSLIAASPQQLAGEAPQAADDIFALGGLIYELVSGRSPYSADATARDIRDAEPAVLTAASGETVPPAVQRLVARMLDKQAASRPDAATVVAELTSAGYAGRPAPSTYVAAHRVLDDELIETSRVSRPAGSKAFDPAAAPPPEADARGIRPGLLGGGLLVLLLLLAGVVFVLPGKLEDNNAVTADVEQPDAAAVPTGEAASEDSGPGVSFSENREDLSGRDARVQDRAATEEVLGTLLSMMNTLEQRAVQRWGGLRFKRAQGIYAEGDQAYLARDYATASDKYRQAIDVLEPLIDEVDGVFRQALTDARAALDAADAPEAVRLFELAVAISPNDTTARAGFDRARNLDEVITLSDRAVEYENNLELEAARASFERAAELDPQWAPARAGLARVRETITQMRFDQRMTEGLTALAESDYLAARAAFRMAESLKPDSREPADGLLQVEQGMQLDRITALEAQARQQETGEQWQDAVDTYTSILDLDPNLTFAQQGLGASRRMAALHERLDEYIAEPDRLSSPATMQAATALVVDITRMPDIGSRLSDQRDELSRLLKRAATPLKVRIVSDNATEVSIYKVGRLGSFGERELELRPGTYVAVGSRPGYRDVRIEFRVAPEIEMTPVVVRSEEPI